MGVVVTAAEVADAWPDFVSLDVEEQGALVRVASQLIEQYTKRRWLSEEATETYDGNGLPILDLKRHPVSLMGSVMVDGVAITDYVLKKASGQLVRGDTSTVARERTTCWDTGTENITITYTAGEEPPWPVRRAGVLLVKNIQQRTEAGAFRREKLGDYEYELGDAFVTMQGRLPSVVEMLLNPYVDQRKV
jgi:hypothetical protein